ncbi:DUF488 family protein [Streptomyces nogalater]
MDSAQDRSRTVSWLRLGNAARGFGGTGREKGSPDGTASHRFRSQHRTAARVVVLLKSAGVAAVVDVRTAPGNRRSPALSRRRLTEWLPEHGIDVRRGGLVALPPPLIAGFAVLARQIPTQHLMHDPWFPVRTRCLLTSPLPAAQSRAVTRTSGRPLF